MTPVFALLLAALAQAPAATEASPPEEMIDFLGRRRLCGELPSPAERAAFAQAEWRRLACGSLAAEALQWRAHFRGNAEALAWLDRDPRDFRVVGAIVVHSWDGPPGAYVRRMEWSGSEEGGPVPFRLVIDTEAENGAATLFTASYGDVPARSFRIDNARFPWLDLQSARAALGNRTPQGELQIALRFGFRRGYCPDSDGDDRPHLFVRFARDRISASYEDRSNCGFRRASLTIP